MLRFIFEKKWKKSVSRGFTLVELMVTLSIVVLVTGVVMIQYSSFNSSVLLTSQAYVTAFDVREAQTLAVSVRGQGAQFREEYGLFFDITAENPNNYILFQDDNANGIDEPARYNVGEELGVRREIGIRFKLLNICATNSVSRTCYTDDPNTVGEDINSAFHDVAISFKRPDFDAAFYSSSGKSNIQSIEIIIGTGDSPLTKNIVVYQTGQVSLK